MKGVGFFCVCVSGEIFHYECFTKVIFFFCLLRSSFGFFFSFPISDLFQGESGFGGRGRKVGLQDQPPPPPTIKTTRIFFLQISDGFKFMKQLSPFAISIWISE